MAPPDVEENENASFLNEFSPVPKFRFEIPVYLVASSNDHYCTLERAKEMAQSWGAELINIGAKGHINSESGIGDWPEGQQLLNKLINQN